MREVPEWMHRHPRARYLISRWIGEPSWCDRKSMNAIYNRARKLGLHVDHIVPLNSPIVCGLHNEFNLQIVEPGLNYHKSNNHWPDMPNEPMELPLDIMEPYQYKLEI